MSESSWAESKVFSGELRPDATHTWIRTVSVAAPKPFHFSKHLIKVDTHLSKAFERTYLLIVNE